MKNLALVLVFIFISFSGFCQLQWESKTALPNDGLFGGISFELDGKIMIGLGEKDSVTYSKEIFEYDPSLDTWTQKNDFPWEGIIYPRSFKVNGDVFICSGLIAGATLNSVKRLYKYNKTNDTWQRLADFPGTARFNPTSFVIDSLVYFGTGHGNNSIWQKDWWQYNPSSDQWTQLSNAPFQESRAVNAFTINGIGYLGNRTTGAPKASNLYWKYDVLADSWTPSASMPGPQRTRVSSFIHNGKAYVGLGTNFDFIDEYQRYNDFYEYDDQSDEWTRYTCNQELTPREGAASVSIGNFVYIIGGKDSSGMLNDVFQLELRTISIEKPNLDLSTKVYPNPASDIITISLDQGLNKKQYSFQIFTILGEEVFSDSFASHTYKLNTSKLGSVGTFFLIIQDSEGIGTKREVIIVE